jgi:Zn-dependent alcohol dehydrogenase
MKSRAAILHGVGQDWQIETLELDPPRAGEVLVKMYQAATPKLDEPITRRYRLDDINDAIKHLREGQNIRGVIDFTTT